MVSCCRDVDVHDKRRHRPCGADSRQGDNEGGRTAAGNGYQATTDRAADARADARHDKFAERKRPPVMEARFSFCLARLLSYIAVQLFLNSSPDPYGDAKAKRLKAHHSVHFLV